MKMCKAERWIADKERELRILKFHLELAKQTEWNWPSTRARCQVERLENQIEAAEFELFVRPTTDAEIRARMATA